MPQRPARPSDRRGAPAGATRRPGAPLGWPVAPMKATAGTLPAGPGWVFEPKWDGHRALVRLRGDHVDVVSSSGLDRGTQWPWIAPLRDRVDAGDAVLDGEVIALDDDGRHSFGLVGDPRRPHALVVFDLLSLDGRLLLDEPWAVRRAELDRVVAPGGALVVTPVTPDGETLWDVMVAQGYEGVIAKRDDSRYLPGTRTPTWRKVKHRRTDEFVVAGWLPGEGRRAGTIGSLLLGAHDDDGALRFVGAAGSGLDDRSLAEWQRLLVACATDACPFVPVPPRTVTRTARWAHPVLVVQVEYAEWTSGGNLRHPVVLGRRDDVDPQAVRLPG